MDQTFLFFTLFTAIISFDKSCQNNGQHNNNLSTNKDSCLDGILVKKGICGQRVIEIISKDKSGVSYDSLWKDESSGKSYQNVFNVENTCSFPATIEEGDKFSFMVSSDNNNDCMQCQAYTEVPNKKNIIKVGCTYSKNQ